MFYSVCGDKFPEPPICVNVFLNKFSASFVAPFRIFDRSRRAAWIPDGFASFLRIVMRQTTPHRPGLPGVERPTEARTLCRSALCLKKWKNSFAQPEGLPVSSPGRRLPPPHGQSSSTVEDRRISWCSRWSSGG